VKRLTQPWKWCRSFGSQPVGSVVGPRWPEAGMAAQVIPSPSSRWTFRPGQSPTADMPTCRPADLPTCRPADLPTCRPADLPTGLADDHRGGDPLSLPWPQSRRFLYPQTPTSRISLRGDPLDPASPSKAQQLSERLLGYNWFAQSSSILHFPIETARSPKIPIAIKRLAFRFDRPALPTP